MLRTYVFLPQSLKNICGPFAGEVVGLGNVAGGAGPDAVRDFDIPETIGVILLDVPRANDVGSALSLVPSLGAP